MGTNLQIWFLSVILYGCIRISHCWLQKITDCMSIVHLDVLAAFILKKLGDTCSLPNVENVHQLSINNFWSCILGNMNGHWVQAVINDVLAAFIGKWRIYTLHAPLLKSGSTSVRNGSEMSLQVRVQVWAKPLSNCRPGPSINPNRQPRYGSMVNSQPVWIGRIVSGLPSESIYWSM